MCLAWNYCDGEIWFTPKAPSTSEPTCIHIREGVWPPAPPHFDFGVCYILCYILRLKHVDTVLSAVVFIGVQNTGSTPSASTCTMTKRIDGHDSKNAKTLELNRS